MASSINLIRRKTVFDPEAVTVLAAALDEAWDLLRKSGSECVRPAYARVMREVVARRIFDLGQGGISDKKQLADGCPYRKSNPEVLMVQSSEERLGNDAADGLDRPRNRRILVQR